MASAFHKFTVGQNVSFLPGSASPSHARVSCIIVRLLPREARDWQYRVKCDHDTHERVVLESQRAAASVKSSLSDRWAVQAMKTA